MKRTLAWLAALLVTASLLAGCGSMADKAASRPAEAPMMAADSAEMGYGDNTAGISAQTAPKEAKRIYTASLELETTAFDDAVAGLTKLAEDCGGWLESSSIYNRESGYRSAEYTVRVPVAQYRSFLAQAGTLCHTLYSREYVEDISEMYYDTAGRLKTQQIKLERLQTLLAKAEKMEDILAIESSISETEQTIEELSGTVQHYDAQVNDATVNLTVQEVYRLSDVEEPATGFASRLGAAFASGWKGFVSSVQMLLVTLAYGWMWVVLLAAVAAVVGKVRKLHRARALGREKKPDDKQGPTC